MTNSIQSRSSACANHTTNSFRFIHLKKCCFHFICSEKALLINPKSLTPDIGVVFKAFLSARFCAALWSHISDCDETYNFWEPLHYLVYGNGMQTWEYSPEFALRSYTYILIHAVPAFLYDAIFKPKPMLVFYFVRCLLALMCALMETYFYKYVSTHTHHTLELDGV